MPAEPKRVLIYRLGSLGDTVIALPALHYIARTYPKAERRLLTNVPVHSKAPAAQAILDGTGLVHGYLRYVAGTRNLFALLRLWLQIVLWRPDVLFYLAAARGMEAARRDARFFRLCGVRNLIGLPLTVDMQRNRPLPGRDFSEQVEPEYARLLRNIAPAGVNEDWSLHLTAGEGSKARDVLRPAGERSLLAVSVGTKVQVKDWGRETWRALLSQLGQHFKGYALVLLGAEEEREACEYAADGWRDVAASPRIINLCGALTPRESAAVLARAALFVGHDSGPMHLAAAAGTPCVSVFAARRPPGMWFPHGKGHRVLYHPVDCMGCNLETCVDQKKKCITSITVEEVFEAVRACLADADEGERHTFVTLT